MKKVLFFSAAAIVLFFASCTTSVMTEEEIAIDETQLNFKIIDGMVVLNSVDELDLLTKNQNELRDWSNTSNFQSLKHNIDLMARDYQENGIESQAFDDYYKTSVVDGERRIELDFPFYSYSSLLNEDGVIRIGDDFLLRFTKDHVYTIHDWDEEKIRRTDNLERDDEANGIYTSLLKSEELGGNEGTRGVTIGTCSTGQGIMGYSMGLRIINNIYTYKPKNAPHLYRYSTAAWVNKESAYGYAYSGGQATLNSYTQYWYNTSTWNFLSGNVNETLDQPSVPYFGLYIFGLLSYESGFELTGLNVTTDTNAAGDLPGLGTVDCTVEITEGVYFH